MDPTPEKFIRDALHHAKALKTRALRRDPDAAIPTIIEFHRDGRLICRAMGDIEEILPVIAVAIPTYNADAVIIISDAYGYTAPNDRGRINPITGRSWEAGDMDRMAAEDAAVERGLLTEMLMVHYEERPGSAIWQGTVGYKLKVAGRRHRRFLWDDEVIYETDPVQIRDEARIPRRIGLGWSVPSMLTKPEFADWTQAQMDCAITLMLAKGGLHIAEGPEPVAIPDFDFWFNQ